MNNVVTLNTNKELTDRVFTIEMDIRALETRLFEEKKAHLMCADKKETKALATVYKNTEIEISILKQNLDITKKQLQEAQLKASVAQNAMETDLKEELDEASIVAALKEMNANFIINGNEWHCIYSNGVRHQPQVRRLIHEEMINHVYHVSDHIVDAFKLKKIAKAANRLYRDVERTFENDKIKTLNQMNELRTFWLKPVFDTPHHEAFDYLVANIVGHNQEYKDQIEKYIAYSYVRPEDIFAPNIDSSAKGGAGRDTLFRMLEIIFTEECCGEAKKETVQGTHNGELNGKIWVKVSEQNNRVMNIEELKNLTGGHNFRLRTMNKDPIQVPRTFRFFMMSNNYEGTAKLTGSGGGAEDRRWEPILSSTSLVNVMAEKKEISIDAAKQLLQDWQDRVYQNETEIAKWLGNMIKHHGFYDYYAGVVSNIDKLVALHGVYYEQMVDRQKRQFDVFIDAVIELSDNSTCYNVDSMFRIYKLICFGGKVPDKQTFGKMMAQRFSTITGIDWEMRVVDYLVSGYLTGGASNRSRSLVVKPVLKNVADDGDDGDDVKMVFDIFDFLNDGQIDEKGKDLGGKPHINNIKHELC